MSLAPNTSTWTVAFESEKVLTLTNKFVMIDSVAGTSSYVLFYQSNQAKTGDYKIFQLAPYSETERKLILTNSSTPQNFYFRDKPKNSTQRDQFVNSSNVTSSIVFVDGKVVLYHDFKSNDKNNLKLVLDMMQSSNDVLPAKEKLAAQQEIRVIQF